VTAQAGTEAGTDEAAGAGPTAPPDPVEELRTELAALRRTLTVRGEEIDMLQVESARQHRRWHRDPTVLTAVLAVAISVLSTLLSQYDLASDRDIQARARLSSLIQQLPEAQQQLAASQNPAVDSLRLIAGDAAELMDETESSSFEKMEVAQVLIGTGDLGDALELVSKGIEQATRVSEKVFGHRLAAQINFQIGDTPGGRAAYQQALDLLSRPSARADAPSFRAFTSAMIEMTWAQSERANKLVVGLPPLPNPGPTSTYAQAVKTLIDGHCP
jgi:hypothetical protein